MKKIATGMLLLLMATSMYSQSSQMSNIEIVFIRYIHDGAQTYSYNLKGIQQHMEMLNLVEEKRDIYLALLPIVEKLEKKQNKAKVASIIFGSVGGGAVLTGGILTGAAVSSEPMKPLGPGIGLVVGGTFLGLGGVVLSHLIIGTNEDDLLRYINSYNILNPESPLEVY